MSRLLSLIALAALPALASTAPVPAAPKDDPKAELTRLAGTWEVTSYIKAGEELIEKKDKMVITFKANGSYAYQKGSKGKIFAIDPSKKPKEIDYVQTENEDDAVPADIDKALIEKGIYKLDGDTFTDCFASTGDVRPKEFKSTKENGWTVVTYKRLKKVD